MVYWKGMTKALQDAVKEVEKLSAERQKVAVQVLEDIVAMGDEPIMLPPEVRAAIEEGIAQADRGELVGIEKTILGRPWG